LKITIIWHNELFNGKGLKAKHMIFVGFFHSNAGKNIKLESLVLHCMAVPGFLR
jgi:hypothetical protein